nr:hypothetical protein [Paracoccus saliphilus]
MPGAMQSSSGKTGVVVAALVVLGLGLFGAVGWLAALVLGLVAGVLLGSLLHWLVHEGAEPMDAAHWAPVPPAVSVPQAPTVSRAFRSPVVRANPSGTDHQAANPQNGDTQSEDDLRRIRGIGPKVEAALHAAGVTRLSQIADWDEARIEEVAPRIGRAASRIRGDDWIGQARDLVVVDREGA